MVIFLYTFLGIILFSALLLASTKKIIHASYSFFIILFGIAGLFALTGADFLAVSQLILYVGGVLVLLTFGLMLKGQTNDEIQNQSTLLNKPFLALFLAGNLAGIFLTLILPVFNLPQLTTPESTSSTIVNFGTLLLSDWLVIFEGISSLLLITLVASTWMVRNQQR
jgi:NADH-quinone oxidoreductase subunit J